MNLSDFITIHGITVDAEWKSRQLWAPDDTTECDVWTVTLHCGDESMTLDFRMGPALNREPNAVDVLECLLSESSHVENGDAHEFAEDMGAEVEEYARYEATYALMSKQADALRELLGDELYNTALWNLDQ